MKLLFILMALPVLASTCKKDKEKDGLLKGKIVRQTCASMVVQVLNNDAIGEDGWKDMMNNNAQYDNVFSVANVCKLPEGVKTGAAITFKTATPVNSGCIFCMMYDAAPKAQFDLTDVSIVK